MGVGGLEVELGWVADVMVDGEVRGWGLVAEGSWVDWGSRIDWFTWCYWIS